MHSIITIIYQWRSLEKKLLNGQKTIFEWDHDIMNL